MATGLSRLSVMDSDVSALLHDARQLEHHELVGLVHELLRILSDDAESESSEIENAWDEEIRHRLAELETGAVATVNGPETIALARAELAKHRA